MKIILTIDIRSNQSSDGWINQFVTKPLAQNFNVFVDFTYVILAILAILTAYRIFSNWQSGSSEDTISDITKWVLGMVLCLALIAGLKAWMALNPVPMSGVELNF